MKFNNSVIPSEKRVNLEMNLNNRIPIIIKGIKQTGITHILLTEKTAILFKQGFFSILKEHNLQNIKIGSFAPDYFKQKTNISKLQIEKKLKFLLELKGTKLKGKIFIFDEIINTGDTINNMKKGLIKMGIKESDILNEEELTYSFRKTFTSGNLGMEEAIYLPGKTIFLKDTDYIYHPIIKNINYYRDTVKDIREIMLSSSKEEISFDGIKIG